MTIPKYNRQDQQKLAMVINTDGLKLIETFIKQTLDAENDVARVTPNSFENGELKGRVNSLRFLLTYLKELRRTINASEIP